MATDVKTYPQETVANRPIQERLTREAAIRGDEGDKDLSALLNDAHYAIVRLSHALDLANYRITRAEPAVEKLTEALENLLSADPDMPTYQDDYAAAEALVAEYGDHRA